MFVMCVVNYKLALTKGIQKTKIMASSPITSWEIDGETVEIVSDFIWGGSKITSWQIDGETVETMTDFISWAPKSLQMVTAAMQVKMLPPWKESYDQPRQHIKKQRHYFINKGPSSQSFGFSSSHVWM